MKVCLAGQSALYWWQTEGLSQIDAPRKSLPPTFALDYTQDDVIALREKLGSKSRLELFSPYGTSRMRRPETLEHISTAAKDQKLFHQISKSLWVCSPELAMLQSLRGRSELDATLISSKALCVYHPTSNEITKQITTAEKCLAVIPSLTGICNRRIAKLALSHAASNAFSQREIQAHLLLCMPKRLGGYGLPKAKLNAEIKLSKQLASQAGVATLHADLLWPEQKVVLEYDSDLHHANARQLNIDSRRRSILSKEGYLVLTMTNNQLKYSTGTAFLAHTLAKALHVNARFTSKDHLQRVTKLREAVLETDLL